MGRGQGARLEAAGEGQHGVHKGGEGSGAGQSILLVSLLDGLCLEGLEPSLPLSASERKNALAPIKPRASGGQQPKGGIQRQGPLRGLGLAPRQEELDPVGLPPLAP